MCSVFVVLVDGGLWCWRIGVCSKNRERDVKALIGLNLRKERRKGLERSNGNTPKRSDLQKAAQGEGGWEL